MVVRVGVRWSGGGVQWGDGGSGGGREILIGKRKNRISSA